MERYSDISGRYLKYQKKRTIITICGVALSVAILFCVLTVYFSNFQNQRDKIRQEANYEMVLFTQDAQQIREIAAQDFVKEAYVGKHSTLYNSSYIDQALFINVNNPYKINQYFEDIVQTYGIEGEINNRLAAYYMQGDIGEATYIYTLMFLAVSFIFAIIAVGIIRNSIQLNTIEQIKDYGILRCVGATDKQLKRIIFRMGFVQELAGIAVGILAGQIFACIFGMTMHIKIHIVPIAIVFVLVSYLGDLFFVMQENSKLVKNITPVEAVRGNLKAKKQKIKRRKGGILGLLFGFEGAYAHKSLMANKSRFFKTVATFSFGIMAVIVFLIAGNAVKKMIYDIDGFGPDYQIYYYIPVSKDITIDEAKSYLPDMDYLEKVTKTFDVKKAKPVYNAVVSIGDIDDLADHIDPTFIKKCYTGECYTELKGEKASPVKKLMASDLGLSGYDEEDYARFEKYLIEGTLDVSEDGIVITRYLTGYAKESEEEETDTSAAQSMLGTQYQFWNYELGDTIDILDFEEYQRRCKAVIDKYEKMKEDAEDLTSEQVKQRYEDLVAIHDEMYKEGLYKTYTIEGIVERNPDDTSNYAYIIAKLDQYYAMTGLTQKDSNGIRYAVEPPKRVTPEMEELIMSELDYVECICSEFMGTRIMVVQMMQYLEYAVMFILFFVAMCSVNIINTSASNLHLRRQELAQLRVIGVSKKRLIRIVMLEGILTAVVANALGWVLIYAMLKPLKTGFLVMMGAKIEIPIVAAILCLVISTAIICGSIYIPIKKMSNDVLDELR